MRIPQEILNQVMIEPLPGTIAAINFALTSFGDSNGWEAGDEEIMLEAYALVTSLQETGRLNVTTTPPSITANLQSTCGQLQRFLNEIKNLSEDKLRLETNQRKIDQFKNQFALTLNNAFGYEFTDGDLKRVQALINELRELITANTELDEDHKLRLLKRLEKMQSEIHKKVSDLNAFYGLAVEASVMLKKVGENAKPIVDRIKELTGISWNTQARAENLPSGTEPPLLENDSKPPAIE